MRSRLLFSLIALLAMALVGAQTDDQQAQKSTEIFDKATKLDILNQILPILFTKEQYRAILPEIERARQRVKETQKLEAAELKKLEPDLDKALAEAMDKGMVPPKETLSEVSKTLQKLTLARRIISEQNTQAVFDVFNKTANDGQKKAATNALDPKWFGLKAEDMKDEDKLKIFVREILLHPMAYDVMRKLSI